MKAKVEHYPFCDGDEDEAVRMDTCSNAAPGIAFRSHRKYTCTLCGATTEWERCDQWRFKYPDEE